MTVVKMSNNCYNLENRRAGKNFHALEPETQLHHYNK